MRITFLCQYFPPEMGAPSARTYEHARYWVDMGHEVTVITGFPNHPTGIIRPEYKGHFIKRENVNGIDLLRTWVYCAANKGFFRRILNFLSFFLSSFIVGSAMTRRPNLVIGTSPQFFCGLSAYLLSLIKRVPFVFEVRDIWPRSAIELGVLKSGFLIRVLESLELFLYRRASLIVVVAESAGEYIKSKGIGPDKITVIPNGIDMRYIDSASSTPEQVRGENGLQGKFIVSYIGTHGMSHALDTVLKTAAELNGDDSIHFLFVGEGAEKERLKNLAAGLNLSNVTFLNEQPREKLPAYYRASNLSIVPLKRLPIFSQVLPSKLFEIMGAGCPIICSVEGEAARLVERSGAGICIEPENEIALANAIRSLREDDELREHMAIRGRSFVMSNYLRSDLAEKYIKAIESPGN